MNNQQKPIRSDFTASSTVADVMAGISLQGKTAIITGGHAGLGLITTQALYAAGARVIVPARDVVKAQQALACCPGVEITPLDLASPHSVRRFAEEFIQQNKPLHLLINNAGIMATPALEKDSRGFELQFATNHLGHFQLTGLLWPALIQAHGARVIIVSSRAHRLSAVVFDDLNFSRRPYDCWQAYGQSKSANIMFARELAKRGEPWRVQSFSVHPGAIYATGLARNMAREDLRASGALDADGQARVDLALDRKSPEQGAATQVWCAVSQALKGHSGQYCEDCNIAPLLPSDTPPMVLGEASSMTRHGVDAFTQLRTDNEKLWKISEEATGVTFP